MDKVVNFPRAGSNVDVKRSHDKMTAELSDHLGERESDVDSDANVDAGGGHNFFRRTRQGQKKI